MHIYVHIVVGDSPMTRIMDLSKVYINQAGRAESSSCSKHFACLRAHLTKETLLRDLDTFVWYLISPC